MKLRAMLAAEIRKRLSMVLRGVRLLTSAAALPGEWTARLACEAYASGNN
ncbi:MAG: hypothetical protein IH623_31050 [Verrucomicrobia bacterium]|nr:hypothetical protein [Verrucomicrobiota bacterium]